jgi:hypothetical protein
MNASERDSEPVASALAALLQRGAESQHVARGDAGRSRLLLRAETDSLRPRVTKRWRVAVPALAVAAALLVWWALPSTLRYDVIGANKDGAYVSAPSDRAVSVHFSDDTLVEVLAGSQLRVEDTSRRGARVLLERGATQVHVIHRDHTRWTFAAGPFEVLVTGTRFDLKWDPTAEVLELKLREGSVEIQTPFGAAPVGLHAGQNFRADLQRRSMTTTEGPELAAARPASAVTQGNPSAAPLPTADLPASEPSAAPSLPPAPSATATRPWSKLVAAGEFNAVLAQANERGTTNCLQGCSAADLSALADAARYSGRTDLADQGLHALRARFARAPEGRSAAFLLGRLRESRGAAGDARTWYDRYLSEAPGGPYAAEALAGKMRTTLAIDGQAAARSIAEDYLRRYPTGVQAGTARGIVGSH